MNKEEQKKYMDDFYKKFENLDKDSFDADADEFDEDESIDDVIDTNGSNDVINHNDNNDANDSDYDNDIDELDLDSLDADTSDIGSQNLNKLDSDELTLDELTLNELDSDDNQNPENSIYNHNKDNHKDNYQDCQDSSNDNYNNDSYKIKTNNKVKAYDLQRLNNITFNVTAEVGHITLSLQQLLSMQVGDTFDFAGLPAKVKLMTNGLCIGDGYLVEINGRVGVKITSLSENNGTAITN